MKSMLKYVFVVAVISIIGLLDVRADSKDHGQKKIDAVAVKRRLKENKDRLSTLELNYQKTESQNEKLELSGHMSKTYREIKSDEALLKFSSFDVSDASVDEIAEMASQLLLTDLTSEAITMFIEAADKDHLPSINMLGVVFYKLKDIDKSFFWLMEGVSSMDSENPYLPLFYNLAIVAKEAAKTIQDTDMKNKFLKISNSCSTSYKNLLPTYCNMKNPGSIPQFPIYAYIGIDINMGKGYQSELEDIIRGKYLPYAK